MKSNSGIILFVVAGLLAVGIIGWAVVKGKTPSPYNDFAQCLTDKGVKMFGAWWCPHCAAQKELFGSAFKKINYIECSPNGSQDMSQQCKDEGVKGYPTWRFPSGPDLSGEQTFKVLGDKVGCSVPEIK